MAKNKRIDNQVMDAWHFLLKHTNILMALRYYYQIYKRRAMAVDGTVITDLTKMHHKSLIHVFEILIVMRIEKMGRDRALDQTLLDIDAIHKWISIKTNAAVLAADDDPAHNEEFAEHIKEILIKVAMDECAHGAMIV